jgi:hypothetical protein
MVQFHSGSSPATQIGVVNERKQKCHRTLGVERVDHLQYAYRMECLECGHVYGANGSDIPKRKCPECQGGASGLEYWMSPL